MHEERRYLISEKQVRLTVLLGSIGMALTILLLFFLATSRPQGKFVILDGTAFQTQLDSAVAGITGYEDLGGGKARIDIDRAMELVVERGVEAPGFFAAGAPAAPGAAPAAPAAAAPPAEAAGTPAVGEPATPVVAGPDGEALFVSTCSACHQATGQGIPGAFPPLAGTAPELYKASRELPMEIVVFGMQGAIMAGGASYNGVMPAHLQLQDDEIAAILDYVMTAWGNDADLPADFQPYTADEVYEVRGMMLTASEVYDARKAAGLE